MNSPNDLQQVPSQAGESDPQHVGWAMLCQPNTLASINVFLKTKRFFEFGF
jgi:hypothetical protein